MQQQQKQQLKERRKKCSATFLTIHFYLYVGAREHTIVFGATSHIPQANRYTRTHIALYNAYISLCETILGVRITTNNNSIKEFEI